MKGWKRFSLYHVLNKRWNRTFSKQIMLDFLVSISKDRDIDVALHTTIFVVTIVPAYFFGWGFWTWIIVDVVTTTLITFTIAILDTYNMYKYRVRQNTVKSIYRIMEVKLDYHGEPIRKVR